MNEAKERLTPLFYCVAVYFSLCFLIGGGVQNTLLSNVILQFFAVPLLVMGFLRRSWRKQPGVRAALLLLAIGLAIPLLQLVPLPPFIWRALPLHALAVRSLEAISSGDVWRPISLTPERSWLSLIAMAPPVAIFVSALQMNDRERRLLTVVALGFGLANAFLGLLQIAQSDKSALRLYEDGADAVGLFANRNHLAALLYSLQPLAAAWLFAFAEPLRRAFERGKRVETENAVMLIAAVVVFFILVGSEIMTRSRAGVMLTLVAIFLCLAIPGWQGIGVRRNLGARRLLLGVAVFAVIVAAQYGLYFLAQRFTNDPLEDARLVFARVTAAGAMNALPFGAGLGSFVPAYMTLEKPPDVMMVYANHAHNDYLELLLETGVAGAAILIGLAAGALSLGPALWRARADDRAPVDLYLARGAFLGLSLIALHSFVDYPLRTEAVLCYAAFCCALALRGLAFSASPMRPASREGGRRPATAAHPPEAPPIAASASRAAA